MSDVEDYNWRRRRRGSSFGFPGRRGHLAMMKKTSGFEDSWMKTLEEATWSTGLPSIEKTPPGDLRRGLAIPRRIPR